MFIPPSSVSASTFSSAVRLSHVTILQSGDDSELNMPMRVAFRGKKTLGVTSGWAGAPDLKRNRHEVGKQIGRQHANPVGSHQLMRCPG
jgi:hypothetical protein